MTPSVRQTCSYLVQSKFLFQHYREGTKKPWLHVYKLVPQVRIDAFLQYSDKIRLRFPVSTFGAWSTEHLYTLADIPDLVGNESKGCECGGERSVLVNMRNSDPEERVAVIPEL
jgi:hypothetical protein